MWAFFNPNPRVARAGDCAVRALSRALDISWEEAYLKLCLEGYLRGEMPSANSVWGSMLARNGFCREALESDCPNCINVREFAREHESGLYVLALDGHVVTLIDGDWHDTWDSGDETILYFWRRKDE